MSEVLSAFIIRVINALIMEAVRTSETSTNINVTTRRYIQEDSKHHIRRRENTKSHDFNSFPQLFQVWGWIESPLHGDIISHHPRNATVVSGSC
jgi:hypothetical protein